MADPVVLLDGEPDMLLFGESIGNALRPGDVIALKGDLGAGKTTLARGMLNALGLQEEAPSPTFAMVQPYDPPFVHFSVAHVDLYRLDNARDARELGLDEYLEDGALIIEWPERLGPELWSHALVIDIEIEADGARRLTAHVPEAWRSRWPST